MILYNISIVELGKCGAASVSLWNAMAKAYDEAVRMLAASCSGWSCRYQLEQTDCQDAFWHSM